VKVKHALDDSLKESKLKRIQFVSLAQSQLIVQSPVAYRDGSLYVYMNKTFIHMFMNKT